MKDKIKKIIGKKKIFYCKHLRNIKNKVYENDNKILGIIKSSKNAKVYYNKNKGIELKNLLKNVEIQNVSTDNRFYYNIDFFKTICSPHTVFGNLCIDYSIILENSLEDLKSKLDKSSQEFYENELYTIEAMELLIDRIINKIKNEKIIENISNIKNKKASTLYEALQRILFIIMANKS